VKTKCFFLRKTGRSRVPPESIHVPLVVRVT